MTCCGKDGADHGIFERRHSLVLVNDGLVRELVVTGGRLDELALVI